MSDTETHPTIAHLTAKDRFRTQTRLAAAAGVKPHTICGKKTSDNPLTFEQMERILRAAPDMGVPISPDDFFPHLTAHDGEAA